MEHKMKLQNKPFLAIKKGPKIIEMRLRDEKRRLINVDDTIEFENQETLEKMRVKVNRLYIFSSFEELYEYFPKEILGYEKDEPASFKDMEKYYSLDEQKKYGVLGIEIEVTM